MVRNVMQNKNKTRKSVNVNVKNRYNNMYVEKIIHGILAYVIVYVKFWKESNCKTNRTWVVKDSAFYNKSRKSWLKSNDIGIYSTHNEGKSVVAEQFIRTLKNKIQKHMTTISNCTSTNYRN